MTRTAPCGSGPPCWGYWRCCWRLVEASPSHKRFPHLCRPGKPSTASARAIRCRPSRCASRKTDALSAAACPRRCDLTRRQGQCGAKECRRSLHSDIQGKYETTTTPCLGGRADVVNDQSKVETPSRDSGFERRQGSEWSDQAPARRWRCRGAPARERLGGGPALCVEPKRSRLPKGTTRPHGCR